MPLQSYHHQISPFTTDELRQWRERLLDLRQGLLQDEEQATAECVVADPGPRELSEGAPIAEVALVTKHDVHQTVSLIDRALAKIASPDPVPFGICEETGKPIERDRLDLMPWTPISSAAASRRERSPKPE